MRKDKLSPVQIMTIIVSSTLGVNILYIQYDIVSYARQDSWISMLIAGIITLTVGLVVNFPLANMYPKYNFAQILLVVFGQVAGRIALFILTVMSLLLGGLSIRLFVSAMKITLLPGTPIYILVILIIIAVVSVAKRGVNAIGSSIDFMFPVYLSALLALILATIGNIDILNVRPVLYNNVSGVLKGILPASSALIGYGAVNYFLPYTISIRNSKKWFTAGIFITTLLYTALTFEVVAAFTYMEVKTLMFPTLTLSKSAEFPIRFLERLETLITTVWIPGVFAWFTIIIFILVKNIAAFFNIKSQKEKYIAYIQIPLLIVIAIFPKSNIQTAGYIKTLSNIFTFIGLGLMLTVTLLALVKKRKEKPHCD